MPARGSGSRATTTIEGYREALDLNLLSTVAMCRAAVPAMQERQWGRVVAITSFGARQPVGTLAASSTARAGVTSFLKVLATEVAADGVTVNSAQPGMHATDRIKHLGRTEEAAKRIPVGFIGDPADFGKVVAFLCSEPARFVTGTSVLIGETDGAPAGSAEFSVRIAKAVGGENAAVFETRALDVAGAVERRQHLGH